MGKGAAVVMSVVYFLLEEVVSVLLSSLVFATPALPFFAAGSFETELSLLLRELAAGAEVSGLLVLEDSTRAPDCEEEVGLDTEDSVDLLPVAGL